MLSKQLVLFLKEKMEYFTSFDKIIVYYDYGQSAITTILTSVLNTLFSEVEFRHVRSHAYKLFQVADMVCTLELTKMNFDAKRVSKSEENFLRDRENSEIIITKPLRKRKCKKTINGSLSCQKLNNSIFQ